MTTILGIQHETGYTIAADHQATEEDRPYRHPWMVKITKRNNVHIAGAGSARMCDVVQHLWHPPVWDGNETLYRHVITEVVPSMRNVINFENVVLGPEETFKFLLGIAGNLFYIADDYSVNLSETGIYGIGSGSAYGMGALEAGADIRTAVKIACKYDVNSGGPIQVVKS